MTPALDCGSHYWMAFVQGLVVGVLTTLLAAMLELRAARRRRDSVLDFRAKGKSA